MPRIPIRELQNALWSRESVTKNKARRGQAPLETYPDYEYDIDGAAISGNVKLRFTLQ
jgi:hypothetical protein